ncbi:MAG: hypothetical protein J4G14_07315 [Dehalococcoidia bacterium]|nr:hypothetical protein [Dehalococcoidia bacterium]
MLRIESSENSRIIRGEGIFAASKLGVGAGNADNVAEGGERFPQVRLQLRGCERCGGGVTNERDWDGDYIRCLQCGWYKDAPGDAVTDLVDSVMARLLEEMEQPRAS